MYSNTTPALLKRRAICRSIKVRKSNLSVKDGQLNNTGLDTGATSQANLAVRRSRHKKLNESSREEAGKLLGKKEMYYNEHRKLFISS